MTQGTDAFAAHLASGATTLARCWRVARRDGVAFGFTDHDRALHFDGMVFDPDDGMSAAALEQTTGLAVDNTEAQGILSHDGITEADLEAGRYDGAEVLAWLVNWADPALRSLRFRGTLGEVRRAGGAFTAELRGLSEALNRPGGRIYQAGCGAVLGDRACGVDLADPAFSAEVDVAAVTPEGRLRLPGLDGYAPHWFEGGRLHVLSGRAEGLVAVIKNDRLRDGLREIEPWAEPRGGLAAGDRVRIVAGCDKSRSSCVEKFNNIINFRGFPQVPGEDWLMAYPTPGARNDGGSLQE
ncbi:DUF2163 domain-containing protein [Mesobaculum littorinae]|uniref:DUF2163 domain-containing protein n=1 Tax=Mesobaculum littorinae TaxID=2486419 RepID=A0A438AK60_9RHOB|nr:DUF2163 domain-containing protein [Mesobaculum littorinae]RVV99005.1 DUF2163 domain-containing protein [Mesobaculum littorinae]